MRVQYIDQGNCEIDEFEIDTDSPVDALERANALFDMTGHEWHDCKRIIISED